MAKLLPCPFCGGKMVQLYDEKQRKVGWEHPLTYDCVLGCVGRDCEGLYVAPNEEELWNTRTPKERGGEKMTIEKAISMIDDYLREPNSIAEDWYKVLKLCREALREKVKE